jgi:hypothetical protein
MKYYSHRVAIFLNCLFVIIFATIVYNGDGGYPADYCWWFIIVAISGLILPWSFVATGESCHACGKPIHEETYISTVEKKGSDRKWFYYHENCYKNIKGEKQ